MIPPLIINYVPTRWKVCLTQWNTFRALLLHFSRFLSCPYVFMIQHNKDTENLATVLISIPYHYSFRLFQIFNKLYNISLWISQVVLVVKTPTANIGNTRDTESIPGSRRSPAGGPDNQLQYSCLKNPMDSGAWWATVHRVAKSCTWLKWLRMHTYLTNTYLHKCRTNFYY